MTDPILLTVEQVAERTGLSEKWLRNMRWKGKGPPYERLGRRVWYKASDVVDWFSKYKRRQPRGRKFRNAQAPARS